VQIFDELIQVGLGQRFRIGFRFRLASRRGDDKIRERFPVVVSDVEFGRCT